MVISLCAEDAIRASGEGHATLESTRGADGRRTVVRREGRSAADDFVDALGGCVRGWDVVVGIRLHAAIDGIEARVGCLEIG